MQPKKRKYQKVDITKRKVQYVVDVQFKSTQPTQLINKKGPELVKIDYEIKPEVLKKKKIFMQFGRHN